MRYFTKFFLSLLCVIVWTGYNALAYQETNSSPQTDNQDIPFKAFYEQTKSFFDTVDQSDTVQCRVHLENSFTGTRLIEFYGAVTLVGRIRSQMKRLGLDPNVNPSSNPQLGEQSRLKKPPGLALASSINSSSRTSQGILQAALDHRDSVISNISSEDVDIMRQELERLQEQWSLCLEGHHK